MDDQTLGPISPERAAIRRATTKARRAFSTVRHYAEHAAPTCPDAYRRGYSRAEWIALPVKERRHALRRALTESFLPLARALVDADPPPRVRAYLALSPEERARLDAEHEPRDDRTAQSSRKA